MVVHPEGGCGCGRSPVSSPLSGFSASMRTAETANMIKTLLPGGHTPAPQTPQLVQPPSVESRSPAGSRETTGTRHGQPDRSKLGSSLASPRVLPSEAKGSLPGSPSPRSASRGLPPQAGLPDYRLATPSARAWAATAAVTAGGGAGGGARAARLGGDRGGHGGRHPLVELARDDVVRGRVVADEGGDRGGGGELHVLGHGGRPHVQRAAEDA